MIYKRTDFIALAITLAALVVIPSLFAIAQQGAKTTEDGVMYADVTSGASATSTPTTTPAIREFPEVLDKRIDSKYKADFRVEYPNSWSRTELMDGTYTLFENQDSSKINFDREDYFKIEVVKLAKKEGQTLEDWLVNQNSKEPQPEIIETKEMVVDGLRAIYQLENYSAFGHRSPAIYVDNGTTVIVINPSSANPKYEKVLDDFLSSFEVIK